MEDVRFVVPLLSAASHFFKKTQCSPPPAAPSGGPKRGAARGDPTIPFPPRRGPDEAYPEGPALSASHNGHSSDRWSSDPGDAPRA